MRSETRADLRKPPSRASVLVVDPLELQPELRRAQATGPCIDLSIQLHGVHDWAAGLSVASTRNAITCASKLVQNCDNRRTAYRYSWSIHWNSSQNSVWALGVVVVRAATNIRNAVLRSAPNRLTSS